MALGRARRSESSMNYWPGFVDALSTLILGIIFLLTVFVVVQFFLQQEVAGKETQLNLLSGQLSQLTELLAMEKSGKSAAEDQLAQLRATLASVQGDRDRFKGLFEGANTSLEALRGKSDQLATAVESEKKLSADAMKQVETLNQQILAVRSQLAALQAALEAREKQNKEADAKIADLGQRLNVALAQRVQELSRFRSEFFGRLRDILGNRPDVRIVGDRFVFQSEVFFESGKGELLPEGRVEIDKIATALLEIDFEPAVPVELRAVGLARHRGGALSRQQGRGAAASACRRLRRVCTDRHRPH